MNTEKTLDPENTWEQRYQEWEQRYQELKDTYRQKQQELNTVEAEYEHTMEEMEKVFENTEDKKEAQKIASEKWYPLMDECLKKTKEAADALFEASHNLNEHEKKGFEE
jgi:uncharacterized protein YukE